MIEKEPQEAIPVKSFKFARFVFQLCCNSCEY